MSLDNAYRAYGRYLVTFNRLNPLVDAAIAREAGLAPPTAAIVTGAYHVKARLGVLRSLLQNAGGEKADVVSLVNEIAQDAKKHPLVQGLATPGGTNSLIFNRPDVITRGGASAEYTAEEMDDLTNALEQRIDTLARALAITPADVAALKRATDELGRKRRNGGNGDDDGE